jgi:hypothetical protein
MWLDSALKSLGFQQNLHEVGIYGHGGDRARKLIGRVREGGATLTNSQLKMSDLGILYFYLGIKVHQHANSITMSQGSYARSWRVGGGRHG